LAPHAPYTASAQLYSEAAALAQKQNLLLTTHLAESPEEMSMFRDASGPLFEFLQSIGRPMDDCGGATPISRLSRSQELDERWIVVHLNEITESDFDLLARGRKFHIAHCPRSHAFFGHTPFALRRLQTLGFNICLGTDSLVSSSSLSLFSEMRELQRQEPSVSSREALAMATVNGARAIGQAASLGGISPGFRADLIAIASVETERDVLCCSTAGTGVLDTAQAPVNERISIIYVSSRPDVDFGGVNARSWICSTGLAVYPDLNRSALGILVRDC
jgi:cytosine/adenosine deaminase-related metal-dependent hydrolase